MYCCMRCGLGAFLGGASLEIGEFKWGMRKRAKSICAGRQAHVAVEICVWRGKSHLRANWIY